jgi:hypothetical protein
MDDLDMDDLDLDFVGLSGEGDSAGGRIAAAAGGEDAATAEPEPSPLPKLMEDRTRVASAKAEPTEQETPHADEDATVLALESEVCVLALAQAGGEVEAAGMKWNAARKKRCGQRGIVVSNQGETDRGFRGLT